MESEGRLIANNVPEFVGSIKELVELVERDEGVDGMPGWISSIGNSSVKEKEKFMKMLRTMDNLRSKLCQIKLPQAVSRLICGKYASYVHTGMYK